MCNILSICLIFLVLLQLRCSILSFIIPFNIQYNGCVWQNDIYVYHLLLPWVENLFFFLIFYFSIFHFIVFMYLNQLGILILGNRMEAAVNYQVMLNIFVMESIMNWQTSKWENYLLCIIYLNHDSTGQLPNKSYKL